MNKSILNKLQKEIKDKLQKQEIITHEDVRYHLMPVIIDALGYNETKISVMNEKKQSKDSMDMCLTMDSKSILIIEVKKYDNKINLSSLETLNQITSYMNCEAVKWGIITNGRRFILIYKDIKYENSLDEQIVLDINLEGKGTEGNKDYIHYLSKDSIFVTKKTYYFKDIAQFRAYDTPTLTTWNRYKGTLYRFFDYLSQTRKELVSLDAINNEMFEDFIKYLGCRSKKTIINLQTHLHHFLQVYRDKGKILKNNFKINHDICIYQNETISNHAIPFILNQENIMKILDTFKPTDDKYKLFFLLNISTARTRKDIWYLKWSDIKIYKESVKVNFGKVSIKYKGEVKELFERLKPKRELELEKYPYVFTGKYGGNKKHLKEANPTDVYKNIKIQLGYDKFTIEEINTQLISLLFNNNYRIEEIVYLSGKSLEALSRYITGEDIINKILVNKKPLGNKKVMPFEIIIDMSF